MVMADPVQGSGARAVSLRSVFPSRQALLEEVTSHDRGFSHSCGACPFIAPVTKHGRVEALTAPRLRETAG